MAECDMCAGTGRVETLEYPDGSQVYFTTNAGANEAIERDIRERGTKTVSIPCNTCNGSGILPVYLESAYWGSKRDAADDELDRAFFGLGKYIRKVADRSE